MSPSTLQIIEMYLIILPIFIFQVRIICNLSGVWLSEDADVQASRLALLNFVLDPFTYVLTRPQYRHALREMCCGDRNVLGFGSCSREEEQIV